MEDDNEARLRREMGERFRKARKNARNGQGFTQAEVGEALKKGDGAVSTWETGRALPDAFVLRWMAQNYGVSVDALLGLKEPEEAAPLETAPTTAAPKPAPEATASISSRSADTIELPMSEFVRVIERAMNSGLSDEREKRGFLIGLIAAIQSRG